MRWVRGASLLNSVDEPCLRAPIECATHLLCDAIPVSQLEEDITVNVWVQLGVI